MCKQNVLVDGASVGVRANTGDVKTSVIVQRVTRTFLEFVAPCELADTHDTILHGGRSRADTDGSIQYGEYGFAGHATPYRSTLAPSSFFAESDLNDTPSASLSAVVEECWPAGYELEQASVLKETAGIPWCGLNTHFVVGYCNGFPMLFQGGQQGSIEFQTQTAQGNVQAQAEEEMAAVRRMDQLMSQAREATEMAASLKMQAAQLRAQVRNTEEGIKAKAPWNCEKQLDCNGQSSVKKASTILPSISEAAVDGWSAPDSGDVIVAHEWPATSHHERRGHFRAAASKSSKSVTTLMLRNIPNSYTREALLGHFEEFGLQDCVDFIYVPMDFYRAAGLGYAFANFTSNKDAERAKQMFDGFRSWGATSQKVCEVSFSYPLQGLNSHIEQYRNSCVMHESVPDCYKPALFEGGIRQPFPMPTKQVPLPRMKRDFTGFRSM